MTRMVRVMAGAAATLMIGTVAGETLAQSTLERVQEQGFIRVGFANESPYGFASADGQLTGESPEVAKAVLAEMGIDEVDGVLTEFGSLIPGLLAGRFDMVAAGMYITPARCAQVSFSEPSYGIGQAFLVPEGNPEGLVDYASIAENADLTLAVMSGAVEAGYARDAGVDDGQLAQLPDQSSLLSAVRSGRADAAALSALSIEEMAEQSDVDATAPFGEVGGQSVMGHGGFAFRPDDEDLFQAFNAQLVDFVGSPDHIDLVTPFGFGDGYLPNLSTEELCAEE